MKGLRITIKGLVQGVYFRKYTREKAMELGIKGFVLNQSDGTVYCEADGEPAELQKLVDWCHTGSPYSKVDEVLVEEKEPGNFTNFEIRRTI